MKATSLFLSLYLSLFAFNSKLSGQDAASCAASSFSLSMLEGGTDGIQALFSLEEQANVDRYTLRYQYFINGQAIEDNLDILPPTFAIELASDTGLHRFTLINLCVDGDTHQGSQLALDLRDSDLQCPIPENLRILDYNANLINFEWDFNDLAQSWHVRYDNAEGFVDEFDVPEPFVAQELAPSNYHLFTLYTNCDDQALTEGQFLRRSPAIQFMIITVDDIKALNISCMDLCVITEKAYLLYSSRHGKFAANKLDFLSTYNCNCTTASQEIGSLFQSIQIYPNPVRNDLFIKLELDQVEYLSLTLLDVQGRKLKQLSTSKRFPPGEHRLAYSLEHHKAGLYWLAIDTGKGVEYLKIMVQP